MNLGWWILIKIYSCSLQLQLALIDLTAPFNHAELIIMLWFCNLHQCRQNQIQFWKNVVIFSLRYCFCVWVETCVCVKTGGCVEIGGMLHSRKARCHLDETKWMGEKTSDFHLQKALCSGKKPKTEQLGLCRHYKLQVDRHGLNRNIHSKILGKQVSK